MKKRHNKTEQELGGELFEQKKKAFLEEYRQTTETLAVKYGLVLVPILRYTDYGIQPAFGVDISANRK